MISTISLSSQTYSQPLPGDWYILRTDMVESLIAPLCMELGWNETDAINGCYEVFHRSACTVYVNLDQPIEQRHETFRFFWNACLIGMGREVIDPPAFMFEGFDWTLD